MQLSKTAKIKIIGYALTALAGVTATQVKVLFPFADPVMAQAIAAWIAFIIGPATLIFSTIQQDKINP